MGFWPLKLCNVRNHMNAPGVGGKTALNLITQEYVLKSGTDSHCLR